MRPEDASAPPFRCLDCHTFVSRRRAHLRRGAPVRAHFAHHPETGCAFSEGEGELHLHAKRRVKEVVEARTEVTLIRHCRGCDVEGRQQLPERVATASLEHRLESGRRADVALLDSTGTVLAVVEVLETHSVDQNKRIDLANVPWCEIRAQEILDGNTWRLVQDHLRRYVCGPCRGSETRTWRGPHRTDVACPLPEAADVVAVERCSDCGYFITARPEGVQCWGANAP